MLANVENTQGVQEVSSAPLAASETIARDISQRMRRRRKELHLSQSALARRSGVSLGSLKRFEQDSLISLESLIKLSVVLGCEDNFSELFPDCQKQGEPSLEDIVAQGHQLLDRIVLMNSTKEK